MSYQVVPKRFFHLAAGCALAVAAGGTASAQDSASVQDEIFVTGSRISRDGFDAPTPVTAIDNEFLLDLGFVNVGAAVQQLPSNKASLTPETNGFGSFNIGAQIANLRALGSNRTLTLVDGRRHIPSTDTANVDLNLIPPLLLDRTEIVTGGASAAYGSDALAGVINVILDKDLEGVRWQMDYGQTSRSEGESVHLSAAGGTSVLNGRGHLIVGGEYEDAEGIPSCMNTRDWCAERPGLIVNSQSAQNGQPRNIRTTQVVQGQMTSAGQIYQLRNPTGTLGAVIQPGHPLYGIQFDANGDPIPYQAGEFHGSSNVRGGDGFSRFETVNTRVPVERYSLFTHLNYELTDTTNLFFETSFGAVNSSHLGAARWFQTTQQVPVLRDNPFLHPTIAAIMDANNISSFFMGKHWDDWGRVESVSNNKVYRLVVGADGALDDNWTWDAYWQYGYNSREQFLLRQSITANHFRALNATTDPATGQPICRDLLSPDPAVVAAAAGCVALNPFGMNQWDPAARDYVLGTLQEWYKMNEWVVAANVQGDLFEMRGGTAALAAGLEYRSDSGAITHDPCGLRSCYWQNYGDDFAGDLDVTEGYVEVALPFLRDRPGAQLFELDAAVRQTHYKNSQQDHFVHHNNGTDSFVAARSAIIDATTWKFSALYDPTEWLRIRATRSRDIRAPNFDELYSRTETLGFTGFSNPWLGTTDPALSINSGNINMKPEKGDTQTFGFVFSPTWNWGEGLQLSIDWWDININDAVGRLGAQNIINDCFDGNQTLCDLVVTPGGVITQVNNATLNLDTYKTSGIDVEVSYRFTLSGGANLGVRLFATKTDEIVTIIGGVATDYVGVTGGAAFGQPEWAYNGTVSYAKGPVNVALQARYIDSGIFNVRFVEVGQPGYSPANPFGVNDNSVDSAFYANLNVRYALPMRTEREWEVFASINNLLDEDPPLAPGSYPTNAAFFDQVGRFYRVGVRANF
jgi:outer membrane receptor protein involved in Fe transport